MIQVKQESFSFDRAGVGNAIGKAKKRELNRFGATVRKIARRSMKKAPAQFTKSGKRKKLTRYGRYRQIQSGKRKGQQRFQKGRSSPPGRPPYYHGSATKNLRSILYQWDGKDSVVVFTQAIGGTRHMTVPGPILQEAGGSAKPTTSRKPAVRYPARPYMSPAGTEGIKHLRKNMRGAIR